MSYLMIPVHSFACDFPRCPEEIEHAEPTKANAWCLAKADGWSQRNGKHYCPVHGGRS